MRLSESKASSPFIPIQIDLSTVAALIHWSLIACGFTCSCSLTCYNSYIDDDDDTDYDGNVDAYYNNVATATMMMFVKKHDLYTLYTR